MQLHGYPEAGGYIIAHGDGDWPPMKQGSKRACLKTAQMMMNMTSLQLFVA